MSDVLKITGRIVRRGEVQEFGAKKFRKAVLVVEIDGQKFNGQVPFEVTKKALDGYDSLRIGDHVEICFNLNGREWNGKYYSSAEAWKIARPGAEERVREAFDPANVGEPEPAAESVDGEEMPF